MKFSPDLILHSGTHEFRAWMEKQFATSQRSSLAFEEDWKPDISLIPYVEFWDWTKCRDTELDVRVAKEQTWQRFLRRVWEYARHKSPDMNLIWCVVPEDDLRDEIVDGGVGWKRYAVYASFAVTTDRLPR